MVTKLKNCATNTKNSKSQRVVTEVNKKLLEYFTKKSKVIY